MINTYSTGYTNGALIGYSSLIAGTTTSAAEVMLTKNTYERYIAGTAATTIKFQLSSTTKINYIGLAAHNAGTHDNGVNLQFSYAATVGGALTTIDAFKPSDNKAIMLNFSNVTAAEIAITFDAVTAGMELGVIYCGQSLQMPLPIYGGVDPIDLNEKVEYRTSESETGQFLGREIVRKGLEANFNFKHLDPDWVRTDFLAFMKSAQTDPFFIKWRPDLYNASVFGYTTKDIKVSNMGGGHRLMSADLSMRAHSEL